MEAASQTDGRWKSTIAPVFLFTEKRTTRVSGYYGDHTFSDISDPSACKLHVDWEKREGDGGGDGGGGGGRGGGEGTIAVVIFT